MTTTPGGLRSGVKAGARHALRWLRKRDRCAVAVELGIISIPFFTMFLGVMEVAYDLYVQAAMDNAVEIAARSVQTGGTTGQSGETSQTFVNSICANLGGLLDCSLLTVGVAPIPANFDYYSLPVQDQLTQAEASSGGGICTSTAGTPMVLKAWYDGPTFLGLLVPAFTTEWTAPGAQNSQLVHVTSATAGFVNEYFAGGQGSGTACSL